MAFPANPSPGDRYYTHTQSWQWSGSAWTQVYGVDDSVIQRVNPDEPAGQIIGPSAAAIGGIAVALDAVGEYDLIQYRSNAWRNTPQTHITDGGNF